jgi:L-ascorbate metabolism protein UlaG (beta-lactamase superfamily)
MKIKWLGHACFLITSESGTRIITDPFASDKNLSYAEVSHEADIVTVSHDHFDHNHVAPIKGHPSIIKTAGDRKIKDIGIRTISTWHDESGGKERGPNLVFCFNVDGINVCHLGDLGHRLNKSELDRLGKVDVLLIPIGGVFTIDASSASHLCDDIKPSIVIPMHYKTSQCQWLKYGVDDFVRGRQNYKEIKSGEIELKAGALPSEMEVIILNYAC